MSHKSEHEYFEVMYERYQRASPTEKPHLLDEVCHMCRWHRKHAIRKLNQRLRERHPRRQAARGFTYSARTLSILAEVWKAAGYPWSLRLKALLPLWLPWVRRHFRLSPEIEAELLAISPRQMDRRLRLQKRRIRQRIYGRTKPGTWLVTVQVVCPPSSQ